jgi:surface-anchored protein
MKNQNTQKLGRIRQLGLAALLTTGLAAQAQTPLYTGHTDVGIAYDAIANEWELHVHDEENDVEYFPATDALLMVKYQAHTTVPFGAAWNFLGSAGSSTWILPNTENPDLLFLGIGAEEIESGIFAGDSFSLALKGVSGPGNFALFDLDTFGNPTVRWNSGDGFTGADLLSVVTGGHSHFNWAFSAPGDYIVTLEASGISTLNGATSSGDVNYLFRVEAVPEPATGALAGVGALALWFGRRNKLG